MVSMTAQWWLDERQPAKEVVAAHVVNLCWNGLSDLETGPQLGSSKLGTQLEDAAVNTEKHTEE
jgi:hypothetical protein